MGEQQADDAGISAIRCHGPHQRRHAARIRRVPAELSAPVEDYLKAIYELERSGEPGVVQHADEELVVACGEGALAVAELQRAGGRRLSAQEFLRGHRLPAGARFA